MVSAADMTIGGRHGTRSRSSPRTIITTTSIPNCRKPSCACARWRPCSPRKATSTLPALDAIVEAYETKIGPRNGARVVAKAWTDPAFKQALFDDASKAIGTLGHVEPRRRSPDRGREHAAAAQHGRVHIVLLLSVEMLGLPPVWYKASPYRSRAVKDPRGVLADFGVTLPKDTEIRVWDPTAETRFSCCRCGRAGTEGWSEERLAEIVTRDSMIGTGLPKAAS